MNWARAASVDEDVDVVAICLHDEIDARGCEGAVLGITLSPAVGIGEKSTGVTYFSPRIISSAHSRATLIP